MSAVAVLMLALGPLQGRDSSASGRLRPARRPSGPHGGPLRAFQVHGVPQGTPETPVNAGSRHLWLRVGRRLTDGSGAVT